MAITGRVLFILGEAEAPSGISSVVVKVAGQTLGSVGTNGWRVRANIPREGRYAIVVTAKTGEGRTLVRRRAIRIAFRESGEI